MTLFKTFSSNSPLFGNDDSQNHVQRQPELYFASCTSPVNHLERVGEYDASARSFPISINMLCQCYDRYHMSINNTEYPPAFPEFMQALDEASDILLLSCEITVKILERILIELKECSVLHGKQSRQIRVISTNQDLKEYRNGMKILDVPEGMQLFFANKLDNLEKIHDRFALLDGFIWHFGVGIGGMHEMFHAISGPWPDIDNSFKKFCNQFF